MVRWSDGEWSGGESGEMIASGGKGIMNKGKIRASFVLLPALCLGLLGVGRSELWAPAWSRVPGRPHAKRTAARASGQGHPIVEVDAGSKDAMLVGGIVGKRWIDQEIIGRRLKHEERYRFYSMTGFVGEDIGGKAEPGDVGPLQFFVTLKKPLSQKSDLIGIDGGWNPLPRKPTVLSNNSPLYRRVVASVLRQNGITQPEIKINRILRVDLEGDGKDEILINATRPGSGGSPETRKGDYTLILMRKIVHGVVKNILVSGQFFRKAGGQMSGNNEDELIGAFDLNGDGKMEIIRKYRAYEANGIEVFSVTGSSVKSVLSAGVAV